MTDIRTPHDLPDVAAVELALGVLDGEERGVALRRVLAEPGFARDVETWRAYLGQLFDLWPEAAAPEGLFVRIERSLDAPHAVTAAPVNWLWPALAGLTSVAAAGLLLFVVSRPPQPLPRAVPIETPAAQRLLVASIAPTDTGTPIAAVYDPARGVLNVTAAAAPAIGRSAELWVIGADKTPHSLGVLTIGGNTSVTPVARLRAQLQAGATLAVTIEPQGGSTTGLPTGPIVLKGALSQV